MGFRSRGRLFCALANRGYYHWRANIVKASRESFRLIAYLWRQVHGWFGQNLLQEGWKVRCCFRGRNLENLVN